MGSCSQVSIYHARSGKAYEKPGRFRRSESRPRTVVERPRNFSTLIYPGAGATAKARQGLLSSSASPRACRPSSCSRSHFPVVPPVVWDLPAVGRSRGQGKGLGSVGRRLPARELPSRKRFCIAKDGLGAGAGNVTCGFLTAADAIRPRRVGGRISRRPAILDRTSAQQRGDLAAQVTSCCQPIESNCVSYSNCWTRMCLLVASRTRGNLRREANSHDS